MGLFDSITGLFDPTSGAGGDLLSGLLDLGSPSMGGGMAQPVNYFPTYQFDPNVYGQPEATPVMSQVPAIAGATGGALAKVTAPILFAIAQKLGLRRIPSLVRAMEMIRKMAKWLSPAATATALGISVADLATLMAANARKKRRRINPANTKALRRSVRRLQSFDHLANKVRSQLAHVGSKHSRRRVGRCGTCRKSPCRC